MIFSKQFFRDHHKSLFLLLWLGLNLFQAAFTDLLDDEAYYWVYSRHMDWGYFDHPPMVALLIKAGYAMFQKELGVRLLTAVMNVLTVVVIGRLLPQKDDRLYYLILLSAAALQIGGMLAVPDVPLMFFAAVYFLVYRSFLREKSLKNTLLLGLSMALMFYSKYHGILLVLFTVISNPRLLRSAQFYGACSFTTILFLPHLNWQYSHSFPSLHYHLVERARAYKVDFTLSYILGQILLFGPLAGWLVLYYAFACPVRDKFERALKFCIYGVLIFFLLSSFKNRVEANWTVMIFPAVAILAHQGMLRRGRSHKLLLRLSMVTVALVLAGRVYMVWNFVPSLTVRSELHNNREWARSIYEKAGNRPVVFVNSYQFASKYMFYSGQLAYSLHSRFARRSQYNLWDTEKQLRGKQVMVAFQPGTIDHFTDSVLNGRGRLDYFIQDPYYSYNLIDLIPDRTAVKAHPGERISFSLQVHNGYGQPLPEASHQKPVLGYGFMQQRTAFNRGITDITLTDALSRKAVQMDVTVPDKPGMYQLKFCAYAGILPPTHNSCTVTVDVE